MKPNGMVAHIHPRKFLIVTFLNSFDSINVIWSSKKILKNKILAHLLSLIHRSISKDGRFLTLAA